MCEGNILYELEQVHKWRLDRELSCKPESVFFTTLSSIFHIRKFFFDKNEAVYKYYRSLLPWQFAVSDRNRKLLAILQENFLEIRHRQDNYQKPIARTTVPTDRNPTWRKLCWSPDGVLIAFATSEGELRCYNTLASLVCHIPKSVSDPNLSLPSNAVVSIFLIETRTKDVEWPYELLVLNFCGNLRSYLVSSTEGYKPSHVFSFGDNVTAAIYAPSFNTLIVAFSNSNSIKQGISAWRLLNEYPYCRSFESKTENASRFSKLSQFTSLFKSDSKRNVVLKMTISLHGTYLACVYSCGSIIIWTLPALRIHQIWHSREIRSCVNIEENETASEMQTASIEHCLTDINWCSDTKLAIVSENSRLIVSNTDTLKNHLARIDAESHSVDNYPVQLMDQAQLANICDITDGFVILNRKQENSEFLPKDADLSDSNSKTKDPQKEHLYVDKIYSLIMLKEVTPQELYERKINDGKFEEALNFAALFSLDKNLVYKKQWKSEEPVTVELIENCLFKITDEWWTIEECCSRIPNNLAATEKLLAYGLQLTDFSAFLNFAHGLELEDSHLNSTYEYGRIFQLNIEKNCSFPASQLRILVLRKLLLSYWDSLTIYKEILELGTGTIAYDIETFNKFRTESPVQVALYFARKGNTKAVTVLFSHYFEELSPHWLDILNNIPECMEPNSYEELLPKFSDANQLRKWERHCTRADDWSESGEFRQIVRRKQYENESSIDCFLLHKETVAEWYKSRIKKVVEVTGLIEWGIQLLDIASKNNINGLEYLRHNLLVADVLIYESTTEEDISLYEIEKLTPSEQLKFLVHRINVVEDFHGSIRSVLVPFLNRCEVLWPNSRVRLLTELLQQLSKNDLNAFLVFADYVSSEPEGMSVSYETMLESALSSIYTCERVDQIDLVRKIVDSLSQSSNNKLNELRLELSVVEMLRHYGITKVIGDVHKTKDNVQLQKALLISMINAKIARTKLLSKEEIYELLRDLMFVQENLFDSLPNQTYLRMFAYTILTTGWHSCIEQYAPLILCGSPSESIDSREHILSYEDSVAVIVEATQYYLNNASSCSDPSILLAQSCLSLVDFHPSIKHEKQFIDAITELKALEVQITPLEVRMSGNKMKIIELALKAKPDSYKHFNSLMSLAKNLQIDEDDKKSLELATLNYAINAAFEAKDFVWCSKTASTWLRDENGCWELCRKLCECKEFDNLEMKCRLIKSVVAYCPDNQIQFTIHSRNDLEGQFLEKCSQGKDLRGNFVSSFPTLKNHANVNFWSTVFDFPSKNEMFEIKSGQSVGGKNLVFSEFYGDVHANCECVCQSSEVEESTIGLLSLRRFLLFQKSLDPHVHDLVTELAKNVFYVDCISSLCLLLLLQSCDEKSSREIFAALPKTVSVVKFVLYYYCLMFLTNTESDQEIINDLAESPSKLQCWTMSSIETRHSPVVKYIKKYKYLLDCGEVDFERFLTDETYKMDSILGTAMYEDRHKLELALSLGTEYGVSHIDIIVSHISSLFFSNNSTTLTERLKEKIILDTLKKNAKYATERIHSSIYGALSGNNYQVLILYYALLKHLAEDEIINGLKPSQHVRLLKKLRSFAKTIDYKVLTSDLLQGWNVLSYAMQVDEPDKCLDLLTNLLSTLSNDEDVRNLFSILFEKSYNGGPETVTEKLKEYSKRFIKFSHLRQICDGCDLNVKYSRKLQSALKLEDNRELNDVLSKMILDSSISTDVIKIITDEIKPDLLTSTIGDMLKRKTNQNELKLILRKIVDCIEANEYEKSWCDVLQSLLSENELIDENRSCIVKILSILKKSEDEINLVVDLLHNSKLILREWVSVHSNITVFDVADENSRLLLLKELVKRSTCCLHLSCIYEMLSFWPPFPVTNNLQTDPYQLLLQKLVAQDQRRTLTEDEVKLVQKIVRQPRFTEEGVPLPKTIEKYLNKAQRDNAHNARNFHS